MTPARPASAEPKPNTPVNTSGTLWPSIATWLGCEIAAWMISPIRVRVSTTSRAMKIPIEIASMKAL